MWQDYRCGERKGNQISSSMPKRGPDLNPADAAKAMTVLGNLLSDHCRTELCGILGDEAIRRRGLPALR
jgi:hypothetical protein